MSLDQPSKPHDAYVRKQLSNPKLAETFLENFLDDALVRFLKLETLSLLPDSYVDKQLKAHYADLVYKCELNDGKEVEVCILIEHKSYVPPRPRLQLLRYLLNAWEHQIKADKLTDKKRTRLRPVIPVVLYHGKTRWRKRAFRDYFDEGLPEALDKIIPEFFYDVVDLNTYSPEQIAEMELGTFEMMVIALQHSRNIAALKKQFERISVVMEVYNNKEADQQIEGFFVYLYAVLNMPPEKLNRLIREDMPETLKKRALSTYEQMILPYKEKLAEQEKAIQEIALEKEKMAIEKEKAVYEKEKIANEKEKAVYEKEKIAKEKEKVVNEKERIAKEKEKVVNEKEKITREKERITREKEQITLKKNIGLIKLCLKLGLPIFEMMEMTQLSQEEVESIIGKLKKKEGD